MADDKHLNGAYYGPSIPPPEQQRPRRHRGRNCCSCFFSFLWKALLAIILFLVIVFLIFYLIVQPRAFKFHVTDAKLTQFNYTTTNNNNSNNHLLRYNLVLNFTARNPNKKLNIYYDEVEAVAFYDGIPFGSTDVITWRNSFRQYKKSTDRMSGVLSGEHAVVLDRDQVVDFERDMRDGVFDIDVKLHIRMRFRLGDSIGGTTKVKVKCELEVPFSSNNHEKSVTHVFLPTECDVNF